MELLERDGYLGELADYYQQVENGSGHTLFLMGEAGIGKTSLVNHFLKRIDKIAVIYSGACDSLFTPRPLGPLFDVAAQIGPDFVDLLRNEKDRSLIFAGLVQRLATDEKPVVLVFEDIHWADEATFDLIKFLARRINRFKCLFLLTCRDEETPATHSLAKIFGEIPSDYFSKIMIDRFSRETVDQLAAKKGYASGEQLFTLTGGNPFYVTEILASYSPGIPGRVKDSILAVFHSVGDDTKSMWEFFSIMPSSRIDINLAKRIESNFSSCIEFCIASGMIVSRPGHLAFKHELFRIAIEESLSPSKRISLHKKMLAIMQEISGEYSLAQLVHHARFADEKELVAKLAPQAAGEAAAVGAHLEASKLYLTAIEYADKKDPALVDLYEHHAYECYLTYQITEAIASQQMALDIWRKRKVSLKEGDALRFLSRLWWFTGDTAKAIALAHQSIEILENGFPTRERALAYSNLSQLCMLCEDRVNTLHWGDKAIDLATRMEDNEILSHALNNVGNTLLQVPASENQGEKKLNRSLSIALEHGFHEHAARAYVNLGGTFVLSKRYEKAKAIFDVGFKYCEERDLDFLKFYMLAYRALLLLETGHWEEAETIVKRLQPSPHHLLVRLVAALTLARLAIRYGKFEEARTLIDEAKAMAMPTHEAQRIIPVLTAELELAWITGHSIPIDEIRNAENTLFYDKNNSWHYTALVYWMDKCSLKETADTKIEFNGPFKLEREGNWKAAADQWKKIGCPYEQALALFEGDEDQQKQGLVILNELGATATSEMLKSKLRLKGVRNIPRGPQERTRNNPAQLTNRQVEILILLHEGLQNKEIADKLFISTKTVDNHISAIFTQLDVNSRAKAVLEAHKLGILKK